MKPAIRERYALRMRYCDGELSYRQLRLRQDYVADADEALALLRQGRVVWVIQNAGLVTQIQRTLGEQP
jgi:hypothetical protein